MRPLAFALLLVPSAAFADEPAPPPKVTVLQTITVVGHRPARPNITIELTRPTAAHEAAIAHEAMRARLSR